MTIDHWGIPQYPWNEGDIVYASALNGAFANGAAIGGPFLLLTGGTLAAPGNMSMEGIIRQGYAVYPPTWSNGPGNDAGVGWYELIAEAQFYTTKGGIAVAAVGRASDYHGGPTGTEFPQIYAFAGYGVADVAGAVGEAMYLEACVSVPGANANCIEMDIVNAAGPIPTINPYQLLNVGAACGIVVASGGGPGRPGPFYPSSAAIAIGANRSNHNIGIIFGATSLVGTDGVTGTGIAIQMAKGHNIEWICDTHGATSALIRSDSTTPSMGMLFLSDGLHVVDAATQANTYFLVNSFGATVTGALAVSAGFTVAGTAEFSGNVGFYGATPVAKQTLSGAQGGNTALASVINALVLCGFVTDGTTP